MERRTRHPRRVRTSRTRKVGRSKDGELKLSGKSEKTEVWTGAAEGKWGSLEGNQGEGQGREFEGLKMGGSSPKRGGKGERRMSNEKTHRTENRWD